MPSCSIRKLTKYGKTALSKKHQLFQWIKIITNCRYFHPLTGIVKDREIGNIELYKGAKEL